MPSPSKVSHRGGGTTRPPSWEEKVKKGAKASAQERGTGDNRERRSRGAEEQRRRNRGREGDTEGERERESGREGKREARARATQPFSVALIVWRARVRRIGRVRCRALSWAALHARMRHQWTVNKCVRAIAGNRTREMATKGQAAVRCASYRDPVHLPRADMRVWAGALAAAKHRRRSGSRRLRTTRRVRGSRSDASSMWRISLTRNGRRGGAGGGGGAD